MKTPFGKRYIIQISKTEKKVKTEDYRYRQGAISYKGAEKFLRSIISVRNIKTAYP